MSYDPLGLSAPLNTLHYVQPRCAPSLYPSEQLLSSSTLGATQSSPPLALVIDDDTSVVAPASDCPSSFPDVFSLSPNLARGQLTVDQLVRLVPAPVQLVPLPPDSSSDTLEALPSKTADDQAAAPRLLSTMTPEDVARLVHHPGTSFLPVRPCNTANASNTKTHWTAEELHRIMGCRKFRNYKHLLQVSRDGEWIDGGKFPPSFGSYATTPKSHRGGAIDRTWYRFLDAMHMDIAFGDCVSVGGFCYALILVDRATCYNWTFSLKDLTSASIISALRLFKASAGSLARTFYSDCDLKLFGTAVNEFVMIDSSKVISAPAKRQSANGLVESHWKVMVHMAWAYLTEKQMPRAFWFYAITHAARMMNAIPGKHSGLLA